MNSQDSKFDTWLTAADADILESLDTAIDTEQNLLQVKRQAATIYLPDQANSTRNAPKLSQGD